MNQKIALFGMKTILSCFSVGALGFALGCGSPADDSTPSVRGRSIAAAPETTQALGATEWRLSMGGDPDTLLLTGYDADNKIRATMRLWKKRSASAEVIEGGVDANTSFGTAHFHYTTKAGDSVVDNDDFDASPKLARALNLAEADVARAGVLAVG
jgi:hypothetical protein